MFAGPTIEITPGKSLLLRFFEVTPDGTRIEVEREFAVTQAGGTYYVQDCGDFVEELAAHLSSLGQRAEKKN